MTLRQYCQLSLLCLIFILTFLWFHRSQSTKQIYYSEYRSFKIPQEIILYAATPLFSQPWERSYKCSLPNTNKQINCTITSKPINISKISAAIYHQVDINTTLLPYDHLKWSRKDIPMILANMESPAYHPFSDHYSKYFDFLSNYRIDSHFPWPYGVLKRRREPRNVDLEAIWEAKDENKTALWIVSNCGSHSGREKIVRALQDSGLEVDVFGSCGSPLPDCGRSQHLDNCRIELTKKYKFYFAFENSICTDYVTEKLFMTMKAENVVPVVLKRSIVDRIGIPEKAVIALDDFEGVEEAVKGLKELGNDKQRYLEYLEWIREYEVEDKQDDYGPCNACLYFHQPPSDRKSPSRPQSWTSIPQCDVTFSSNFLANSKIFNKTG